MISSRLFRQYYNSFDDMQCVLTWSLFLKLLYYIDNIVLLEGLLTILISHLDLNEQYATNNKLVRCDL